MSGASFLRWQQLRDRVGEVVVDCGAVLGCVVWRCALGTAPVRPVLGPQIAIAFSKSSSELKAW